VLREAKKNSKLVLINKLKIMWRPELAHIQELNQLPMYKQKSKEFVIEKIIEKHKPKVVFLENVRNLVYHDKGRTFKTIIDILENKLKYKTFTQLLNTMNYANIPQNRERIFIVAFDPNQVPNYTEFKFPEPIKLTKTIHDILEKDKQDDIYYYKKEHPYYEELDKTMTSQNTVYQWRRVYVRENKNKNILEDKIRSKIAITRANWIELLKDIKTADELLYFLQNDLKFEENKDFKIAGSKTYKYIKILNLQERNKKSNSLNLNGKDFSRFILKDDKNRTFPRHKSKKELEDILLSYYETRIENIYKRKSKKSKEKLNNIYESENYKIKSNKNIQNSFKYLSYQQKLFIEHYDYLIKDKLEGYYVKKENNEVIVSNFSKNIQIIDKGEEIVSVKNRTNIEEQVKIMIQIALAKDWKLENIEPNGDEYFINEANRQIADLILKKNQIKNSNVEIKRVKSPLQQQKVNLQNEDLNPKINLQELKEKLDVNFLLEYVKENYKLDISNFSITDDNKIDNLKNKQKPKNVIDFLQA
jgi:site-specific DNA-cytosine methylase